nr:hypothetical protein [Tanacetum cinerariifolium]
MISGSRWLLVLVFVGIVVLIVAEKKRVGLDFIKKFRDLRVWKLSGGGQSVLSILAWFNIIEREKDNGLGSCKALDPFYRIGIRDEDVFHACAVASVSSASAKIPVSALPNMDTLSNAVIYSFFARQSNSLQLDNDDLKQIDADDLEEIDLKWQMAMLTVRARKGHFARECRSPKDTRRNVAAEPQRRNVLKRNQPTMPSWHSPLQVLPVLTMSQTNGKTGLGYHTQVFTNSMFDCDEMFTSETDETLLASPIYDRYQSGDGYHAIPLPYTGTFMPPKPDLVFHDSPNVSDTEDDSEAEIPQSTPSFVQPTEQVKTPRSSVKTVETSIPAINLKTAIPKPKSNGNSRNRKACFICKSLTHLIQDSKTIITKSHSPLKSHINHSPSPKASNFPPKVTAVKVPQMCDKKNNVLFTNTECIVLSPEFKLLDENQVLLRVPRENNMYNVDLKNIIPSGDLTCLFAKATLDESNLWHRRLGHINFKTMNKLVKGSGPTWLFDIDTLTKTMNYQPVTIGKQSNPSAGVQEQFDAEKAKEESAQQYVLFPVCSAQSKKHDDKTKREAKGKSPIESSIGYRNLSAEFEDFFDNSINEVNATGTSVPAVGQLSTNNTNTFSAAGPSNTAVSPIHGKSSYVDTSQYPDDPNMPELEDITYSVDEDDVGAEADFTNLETTITVSPIPTTIVHKDYPVTQIIGDLSSATQTRSMKRVAKDQGGLSQINNDDFHICMFSCFLSQEEPKRKEGIDYKEVFASVARIESIRLFLAYASFMGFMVYQIDVKSAFLYGTIEEEKPDGIFISQDKYVAKILRKFSLTGRKSASTPIDTEMTLLKDPDVKRIFRYLKGKPHLGLWYPKDLPFNLVAYSDSDYAGASLNRKSTTGGCQFLGCRLISWQCKKQTVVATSSTEAEYVATASCCAQVLWIQNQLLDYGVDTPLFEGMIVAKQDNDVAEEGAASVVVDDVPTAIDEPSIPSPTPTTQPPLPSQDLPSTSQVLPTLPPSSIAQPPLPQQQPQPSHDAKISMDLLHTLLEKCSTLTRRVEHLEQNKIAQTLEITNVDVDVTLKDVATVSKEVEVEKTVEIKENDDELEPAELKEVVEVVTTAKLMTKVVTAASATITAADTSITVATITAAPSAARRRKGVVIRDLKETASPSIIIHFEPKSKDKGKGIMVEEPKTLKKKAQIEQDEAYEREEQMEKEDSKALKRMSKSQAEKAAKKQKLDEEATPFALKVLVVDYAIHTENNKPYFKIIRADRTHQLFLSFLSLLRNFDREDLEVLWQLAKERFASSKPRNFSDDFLLTTLTYMFEKPNVEDQVWKSQRGIYGLAKVKSWKLLESCGVHIITLTTTQMILLVERRYPLTRFVRQQQQEGFRPEYCLDTSSINIKIKTKIKLVKQEGLDV